MSTHERATRRPVRFENNNRGQALIEYGLILALAIIGLVAILVITGPSVGNVFSNTVYNLLGQTTTPQDPLDPTEFWEMVTAVASYTPEQVDLITNTPLPDTPEASDEPPPPVATDTFTPVPSSTFTPVGWISPTPEDENFGFTNPFNGDDPDEWQDDNWLDLLAGAGPWDAEYWDDDNDDPGGCNDGAIFNSDGVPSRAAKATSQVERVYFPDSDNDDDYWKWADDRPYPGVDSDFCSRFETTIDLTAQEYSFRHISDDKIWVYVIHQDNTVELIFNDNTWSDEWDDNTPVSWTNSSPGTKTIRIVHVDTGGGARLAVEMIEGDLGTTTDGCDWQLHDDRYRSAPDAWDDSPGRDYYHNQFCVLKLRGTIDLSGASRPSIEFYDAYNLNNYDEAIVGVSIAGSGVWNDYVVHEVGTNYAFQRQLIDLTNFAGTEGTVDYTGRIIELRFAIKSDGSNRARGWWVDDIKLNDDPDYEYTIGFKDDVEGAEFWLGDGQWARTSEKFHSASQSWTDSPGENYERETNSSLTLNGHLNLAVGDVQTPQIAFWHSWNLNSGDEIYVEVSSDRRNWVALRSGPSDSDDWLERESTESNFIFQALTIPAPYNTMDRVYVRFRLYANNNWNVNDGWHVDDIEFRNKPTEAVLPGWCDFTEEGSGDWIPNGDWALVNSDAWFGLYSWHDSPGGDYVHGSETWLEMKPYVDLSGAGLTRPVVEFWTRWDLGERNHDTDDGIHVDVSTDDWDTYSTLWSYDDDDGVLPGYSSNIWHTDRRFNANRLWTRHVVELSPYIGESELKVRFRLDARDDGDVADGWYLDSLCIKDMQPTVMPVPFADDLEGGSGYWMPNGDWQLVNDSPHSGGFAFSDSFGVDFSPYTNNVLELLPIVDLQGTTLPTLYYWQRHELNSKDTATILYRRVDANGVPLTEWNYLDESRTREYESDNVGWHRVAVDLSPYIGNRYLQFQFMLEALRNDTVEDGWAIDDLRVVDRYGNEDLDPADPWFEDVEEIDPDEWVMEGTWERVQDVRNFGSGGALGPGQWQATWYDDVNNGCSSDPANPAEIVLTSDTGTATYDEIDFNWGSGRPSGVGLTSSDTFGGILTRDITFNQDTSIWFSGITNNGLRIYDDGLLIFEENWLGCAETTFDRNHANNPYIFTEGDHTVEVHFYENSSSARLTLNFNGDTWVFHDSPDGDYIHEYDTAVELEGAIDLAGLTNPVIFWDERYDIGSGDVAKLEASSDGGFNWQYVAGRWSGTNWDWNERWADLSWLAGQRIAIRFRMEALNKSWSVGDGYWVDNIRIVE